MTERRDKSIVRALWSICGILLAAVIAFLFLVVSSCAGAYGQEPARRLTPLEAVFAALQDASQLPAELRPYTRYVYCGDGSADEYVATSYAFHAAIWHTSNYVRPVVLANGYVLRMDFSEGKGDLKTYERLFGDPTFNVIDGGFVQKQITVAPYIASDGKTYTRKVINEPLRFHGGALPHVQPLADLLGTHVPIVEVGYLLGRSLATIDMGLGEPLYYSFARVRKSETKGLTDEQQFFKDFGIDQKDARNRLVVGRSAMEFSGVTSRLRAVELIQGTAHPNTSPGHVWATYDVSRKGLKVQKDVLLNLMDFLDNGDHEATEVIGTRRNGFQLFALFNGKGELQNVVPPEIAYWGDVPKPFNQELQCAISCIVCHGTKTEMGFKSFANEVPELIPLFELTDLDREKLLSAYQHKPDRPLFESRQFFADAVFLATNGRTVDEATDSVWKVWSKYFYALVDAQAAVREAGYDEDELSARRRLATIPTANPHLKGLVLGRKLTRTTWNSIKPDVLTALKREVP